jgi:uncharacterized protein (DUF885 family)
MRKVGLVGSLEDLFAFMRQAPRFYKANAEELFEEYVRTFERVQPMAAKVIAAAPRAACGIEPIPAAIAPYQPTGFYQWAAADGSRDAAFMVNLHEPQSRPTWEIMALTLHESVPGHHVQIARAMEATHLPEFRRHGRWTAFVEGWALYAESLGDEMGLYEDPYSKLGHLVYGMWRAVRLVVDTGIHALGWDRRRAILFLAENTPRYGADIENEIDRYIAWPGQALAYTIGDLTFKRLRQRAVRALGARFDLRAFHEMVLEGGALPLDVLEQVVEHNLRTTPWQNLPRFP